MSLSAYAEGSYVMPAPGAVSVADRPPIIAARTAMKPSGIPNTTSSSHSSVRRLPSVPAASLPAPSAAAGAGITAPR